MSAPERFNAATFFVDRHVVEGRGDRTAFRFGGRSVTYGDLAARVDRFATALAATGVVDLESRLLLVLDDTPDFAAAFWTAAKLGAVAVPVSPGLARAEYEFLLNDSRARVAVIESRLAVMFDAIRPRCPFLEHVVVAGDGCLGAGDGVPPSRPAADTLRDDVVYWGYTSGSTGRPKAAVHSHKDFVAAADMVGVGVFGIGPDDVTFSASKMFFAYGLGNSLYFPARVGAASVLVAERVTPEGAFDIIARERPTVFFTVPTLYARMLQVPDAETRYDLASLRLCVSSGETLPPAVFDAWQRRFKHELLDVVGSTEALHDFIANRPGAARRGSAGRLVTGFEAKLVDDSGGPVPDGVVGHLLIKGETMSPYYWNRVERTRATMQGEWLRTGDMFSRDADGYFYFAGRSDDMLKVAGMWVAPAEVEAELAAHPAVLEAAVVGVRDSDGLVRPRAFVVPTSGTAVSDMLATELRVFLRARLAPHKVPDRVEFLDELPKTANGKIQRFRLRPAG
jgi:benzoate-CoA ligase family protein